MLKFGIGDRVNTRAIAAQILAGVIRDRYSLGNCFDRKFLLR